MLWKLFGCLLYYLVPGLSLETGNDVFGETVSRTRLKRQKRIAILLVVALSERRLVEQRSNGAGVLAERDTGGIAALFDVAL